MLLLIHVACIALKPDNFYIQKLKKDKKTSQLWINYVCMHAKIHPLYEPLKTVLPLIIMESN